MTPVVRVGAGLISVVVVLGGALGYYYLQSSNTISTLNQTISSQVQTISSQSNQLTQRNSLISSLNATIRTDTSKIAEDTSRIANLTSTVTTLQTRMISLVAKAAQQNTTIASLNNQIVSLNAQIGTAQSQISSLQAQVSQLQAQVTAYANGITLLDGALQQSASKNDYPNFQFSVSQGFQETFPFSKGTIASYFLVGVVTSTSQNTIVSSNLTSSMTNVGSSGVALLYVPAQTPFKIFIYDQNTNSFSATINMWVFY